MSDAVAPSPVSMVGRATLMDETAISDIARGIRSTARILSRWKMRSVP